MDFPFFELLFVRICIKSVVFYIMKIYRVINDIINISKAKEVQMYEKVIK